ncbi:unnamed protein product [Paramecium sonneborni]|uniref:Uncharacterized protein n=1 Tax=Paramecium sonneborni TaxID=65129 RepID=A0A8S1NU77_9CILI|nr:unnamed protein product [Paramecium sonneborni]
MEIKPENRPSTRQTSSPIKICNIQNFQKKQLDLMHRELVDPQDISQIEEQLRNQRENKKRRTLKNRS